MTVWARVQTMWDKLFHVLKHCNFHYMQWGICIGKWINRRTEFLEYYRIKETLNFFLFFVFCVIGYFKPHFQLLQRLLIIIIVIIGMMKKIKHFNTKMKYAEHQKCTWAKLKNLKIVLWTLSAIIIISLDLKNCLLFAVFRYFS